MDFQQYAGIVAAVVSVVAVTVGIVHELTSHRKDR